MCSGFEPRDTRWKLQTSPIGFSCLHNLVKWINRTHRTETCLSRFLLIWPLPIERDFIGIIPFWPFAGFERATRIGVNRIAKIVTTKNDCLWAKGFWHRSNHSRRHLSQLLPIDTFNVVMSFWNSGFRKFPRSAFRSCSARTRPISATSSSRRAALASPRSRSIICIFFFLNGSSLASFCFIFVLFQIPIQVTNIQFELYKLKKA